MGDYENGDSNDGTRQKGWFVSEGSERRIIYYAVGFLAAFCIVFISYIDILFSDSTHRAFCVEISPKGPTDTKSQFVWKCLKLRIETNSNMSIGA